MGDVVEFGGRSPQDVILQCDCGCQSFSIDGFGDLTCAGCSCSMEDRANWAWMGEDLVDGAGSHTARVGADDFSLRSAMRGCQEEDVVALVHIHENGRVGVWDSCHSKEELDWLKDRFARAEKLMFEADDAG